MLRLSLIITRICQYLISLASLDGQFMQKIVPFSPKHSTFRLLFNPTSMLPLQNSPPYFDYVFDLCLILHTHLSLSLAIVLRMSPLSIWIMLACLHPFSSLFILCFLFFFFRSFYHYHYDMRFFLFSLYTLVSFFHY